MASGAGAGAPMTVVMRAVRARTRRVCGRTVDGDEGWDGWIEG